MPPPGRSVQGLQLLLQGLQDSGEAVAGGGVHALELAGVAGVTGTSSH